MQTAEYWVAREYKVVDSNKHFATCLGGIYHYFVIKYLLEYLILYYY